jgi:hypothetical protein
MTIRTFQPGDDLAQVSIYNEAAGELPCFKPATLDEVRRRGLAPDFDPSTRFFALVNNRPMGYISFHASGRLSFPWTRKGHEALAEPLLKHALDQMKQQGHARSWSAYRGDWAPVRDFFLKHGFAQSKEIVNWVMDLAEMPTPAAKLQLPVSPLTPAVLPELLNFCPGLLRVKTTQELEKHLLHNEYFPADSVFVLRGKTHGQPVAAGILVANPSYSHPRQVDAQMPCFRLGAFGTEGLTTKRLNGLFSVLMADTKDVNPMALDMLGYAVSRLETTNVETIAAQVPSDMAHLMRFYKQYFIRQGSFPIYERALS